MSKGNMFMGQARGKVGSVVFARVKGQQVTRAYNEAPKNPRSENQMRQRSLFMSAVKFFSQGRQNFFQFAFEDRKEKESDYNAFMRHNAKAGTNMTQAMYAEGSYPAVAPFIITAGSLPTIELNALPAGNAFSAPLAGLAASATMGDLSARLIDVYGLQQGDIITILTIAANGSTAENTPEIRPDKRGLVKWEIVQFIIDSASTAAIADVLGAGVVAATDAFNITVGSDSTIAVCAAIVASRQTLDGLKVSDTELVMGTVANTIYVASHDEAFIGDVLADWKAAPEAILQGSLVQ